MISPRFGHGAKGGFIGRDPLAGFGFLRNLLSVPLLTPDFSNIGTPGRTARSGITRSSFESEVPRTQRDGRSFAVPVTGARRPDVVDGRCRTWGNGGGVGTWDARNSTGGVSTFGSRQLRIDSRRVRSSAQLSTLHKCVLRTGLRSRRGCRLARGASSTLHLGVLRIGPRAFAGPSPGSLGTAASSDENSWEGSRDRAAGCWPS